MQKTLTIIDLDRNAVERPTVVATIKTDIEKLSKTTAIAILKDAGLIGNSGDADEDAKELAYWADEADYALRNKKQNCKIGDMECGEYYIVLDCPEVPALLDYLDWNLDEVED